MNRLEIMKRRILLLVLAAVFVLPAVARTPLQQRLEKLERAIEVTPLESTRFDEKYELVLRQPLDWQAPEKGSFTHPILVTEGYGAKYAYRPDYREELSQLLDANIVFVEHRYFLGSTPDPRDWHYLTAEASACDLHDVRQLLGAIYPGKWIATGISKGGTTTMLYATFFPGDVDGYVPYVGPVNRSREDGRHEKFLRRVGTADERAAVERFQTEVLRRRDRLMPRFEAYCREKGYEFRAPLTEIYDLCALEYASPSGSGARTPTRFPLRRLRTTNCSITSSERSTPNTSCVKRRRPRFSCRRPANWVTTATTRAPCANTSVSATAKTTCGGSSCPTSCATSISTGRSTGGCTATSNAKTRT